MQITDRAKDVYQSPAAIWISEPSSWRTWPSPPRTSRNAAVIGILHPKWDERAAASSWMDEAGRSPRPQKADLIGYLEG